MDENTDNPYNLPPILLKRFGQFKRIDDNTKRFQRIIELGKKLETFPSELKTESNQVHGCTSLTYIFGRCQNNKMHYLGDSNSHLVKGLVALLVEGFNDQSPEDIEKINPDFMTAMGLAETLTTSRADGFMNTFQMMKKIAKKN